MRSNPELREHSLYGCQHPLPPSALGASIMPGAIRPNRAPSELCFSGVRARLECSLQADGREGIATGMGQEVISVMSSSHSKAPRNNTSDPTGDARRGDFRPLKIPGAARFETLARKHPVPGGMPLPSSGGSFCRFGAVERGCQPNAQASPSTRANRLLRGGTMKG